MFSPLARGVANWDGGIKLDQSAQQLYSDDLLLPQIILKTCQQTRSVKSLDSNVAYSDGQLLLPKTFVTRRGALLLFTPSEELLTADDEDSTVEPNVYEDGLKLKTVGNLINSVLQFGKEEEQAWEGLPSTPPSKGTSSTSHHQTHHPHDKKAFLHFLHYLDSDCLTADKHAQPGCDPDFYLDELKNSSRAFGSNRRSESQTPYSCRNYASLLEDDKLSDIIQEYIKWNRKVHQVQKEERDDINEGENLMDNQDFQERQAEVEEYGIYSTAHTPRYSGRIYSSSPQFSYYTDDSIRPGTAPIPPAPGSPRANPRITSGKIPPPKRALGSMPDNLEDILRTDVMPGRTIRRGPSPRLKFSRSTSPVIYPDSREGSPKYGCNSRLETPVGLSENWSRADEVIEEVEEYSQGCYTRPVSSASFRSIRSSKSKEMPDDRPYSADKYENVVEERTKPLSFHSRSESLSSVSNQQGPRSMSGKSRAHTRSISRSSHGYQDELEPEHERATTPLHNDPSMLSTPSRTGSAISRQSPSRTNVGTPTIDMITSYHDLGPMTSSLRHDDDEMTRDRRGSSMTTSYHDLGPMTSSLRHDDDEMTRDRRRSSMTASYDLGPMTSSLRHDDDEMTRDRRGSSMTASYHDLGPMTSSLRHNDDVMTRDRRGSSRRGSSKMSQSSIKHEHQSFTKEYSCEGEKMPLRVKLRVKSASTSQKLKTPTTKQSRPCSAPMSIPGDETNVTLATLGSEVRISDVIEVMPRHQAFVEDSEDERDLDSPDVAWPVNIVEGLATSDDDDLGGYGSAAEEVNIDLPASPSLAGSGFFRLDVTWSPAPPDGSKELDYLDTQVPSEAGATGLKSRSPSSTPTPVKTSPCPVFIGADEDNDVDSVSANTPIQWPPQTIQKSSSPTLNTAIPPLPAEVEKDDSKDSQRVISPSIYHETINIERSRPSSPISEIQRHQPVSVAESVVKYLETGLEPQERPRSGRRLKNLETTREEDLSDPVTKQEKQVGQQEKQVEKLQQRVETIVDKNQIQKQVLHVEKQIIKQVEQQEKPVQKLVKPVEKVVEVLTDIPSKTGKSRIETKKPESKLTQHVNKNTKGTSSTTEQLETRKDYINIVLNKPKAPIQLDQIGLQKISKESDDGLSSVSSISVAPTQSLVFSEPETPKKEKEIPKKTEEASKNDLSDLAALINRNKSAKVTKEKKEGKKKAKATKAIKAAKKNEIKVDPENIQFDTFNTPEMLEHMDDELKQFVQQQGISGELLHSEENKEEEIVHTTQHVNVPQIAPTVPPEMKNAYMPSKPKKPTKQELVKKRAEARKAEKKRKDEEKKKKDEEKRQKEEELRILKEKEDEQARAREEAEIKQQAIEEEKARRLEEEERARVEEEEAMEKLKDAKRKAREEREQRRAAEAERRKLEVQRKRDEKKRKEEEMREKEKEIEQIKFDQDKRRQELMEARKRQEELDRLEDERRLEEERLRAAAEEEEQRRLEEQQILEAEEELRRLQEEREYKEQMRRIAEARERKLREQEEERLRQEEQQRRAIEEQRRRLQEEEKRTLQEQKKRLEMAKRLEEVARLRVIHEAAHRKAMLLKRREDNLNRMKHLKSVRQDQSVTRSHTFTYYVRVPRQIWELPIGFGKQKKGFRVVRKKTAVKKT